MTIKGKSVIIIKLNRGGEKSEEDMVDIIVDTETTGLSHTDDRILEFACRCKGKAFRRFIKHKDNKIKDSTREFHPKEYLEQWRNEAITEEQFGKDLKDFLNSVGVFKPNDAVYIAHNADYDKGMCTQSWENADLKKFFLGAKWICTLQLARKLFPKLKSRKLGELAKAMNIKVAGNLHEAETDIVVLEEVYEVIKHINQKN